MKLENLKIGGLVTIVTKSPSPTGEPVPAIVREINVDEDGNEKPGYEGKAIGVETVEHFPGLHVLTPTEERDSSGNIVRDAGGHALGRVASGHGWYTKPEWLAPRSK